MIMARTASFVVRADASLTKGRFTWVHMALIAALASIGTSWFYQTPIVTAKAEQTDRANHKAAVAEKKLQIVVTKDVPALKSALGCEHLAKDVALDAATGDSSALAGLPQCPSIASVAHLGKPKP